ncbi:MAG: hypothetical protein ACKOT0_04010 [bacterium]
MKRIVVLAGAVSAALVLATSPALAGPERLSTSWTPHPVKGFSGDLGVDQPKVDSSSAGVPTAAWFASNQEVVVSTYDGSSWGCPIILPVGLKGDGPPDFDTGADGTVAVGSQAPGHDAWVYVRPAGQPAFTGVGTGTSYPSDSETSVATSGVRTVAVWTSESRLIGAEFLPGATSAKPRLLATDVGLRFQKIRMDADGNAVVVFRSTPDDGTGDITQNWLLWPAGQDPTPPQRFDMDSPTDFVDIGAFQASPSGRVILAVYDNGYNDVDQPAQVVAFTGTTTTGFGPPHVVAGAETLRTGAIVTAISQDGAHATVAYREDLEDNTGVGRLHALDPVTGAVLSSGSFDAHPRDEIDFFKVLQMGPTAYASWIRTQKPGGIVMFDGTSVTQAMSNIRGSWIGLFPAGGEPRAYWSAAGTFTSTLPHKALRAKPTMTTVRVGASGAITVKGKVTPAAAATACAGATASIAVANANPSIPGVAAGGAIIGKGGGYSWSLRRSDLKGCTRAKVTVSLRTPDSATPVAVSKTVRCRR